MYKAEFRFSFCYIQFTKKLYIMAIKKFKYLRFKTAYEQSIVLYGKNNSIANENYHNPNIWIDPKSSIEDQVRSMVLLANEIQSEICNCADSIKIDNYKDIKELIGINKDSWKKVVSFNSKKDSVRQRTLDKHIRKTEENIKSEMYTQFHLDALNANNSLPLVPDKNVDCEVNAIMDDCYIEILNESTNTRTYIDNILYKKYRQLANAAEYITHGDVTYDRFKLMVDLEHYLGGYPNPGSAAKIDKAICRFLEAYYLLTKYHSPLFSAHFDKCMAVYNNMFALSPNELKKVSKDKIIEKLKFDPNKLYNGAK